MRIPTYQFVAQMSAALAVVVSLGFVAYELKQARDIALAEIYQQRSSMGIELLMNSYNAEQIEEAFTEIRSDNPKPTEYQLEVLGWQLDAHFIYFENIHFQQQLGMVTDEEWFSTRELIRNFFRAECVAGWWNNKINKSTYRNSFALVVDELITQTEIPPCPLAPPE